MPVLRIDSPENPRVKQVSALLKDRSARVRNGMAVIENEVMLREALSCGIAVEQVFFDEMQADKYSELIGLFEATRAEVFIVSERVMNKLTALETPQGVSAVIDLKSLPRVDIRKDGKYIVCERMSDPGNLGTVIRTADAMGFDGVILSSGSVDTFSPKVIRATMGSIFRLPVLADADLKEAAITFRQNGVTTIAAVLNEKAAPANTVTVPDGVAVFIGNEAAGLRTETVALTDISAYIPMAGKAESLNAAVAASIFMWIFRNK